MTIIGLRHGLLETTQGTKLFIGSKQNLEYNYLSLYIASFESLFFISQNKTLNKELPNIDLSYFRKITSWKSECYVCNFE